MRASGRGFLALVDAMIFTVVIMIALSALIGMGQGAEEDGRDASAMLEGVLSAEVRMSDLAPEGDGSLVRVSDLCAMEIAVGGTGVRGYLEECMGMFSQGRPFLLELTFGEGTMTVGTPGVAEDCYAETEVPVTTGGVLRAELTLYS